MCEALRMKPDAYQPRRLYLYEALGDAEWNNAAEEWRVALSRVKTDGELAEETLVAVCVGDVVDVDPPVTEGDRCVIAVSGDADRVAIPIDRTATGPDSRHPWKLRVRDGNIEVFEGLAWFHGTQVKAAPGVWEDTGLDVSESLVSVYMLIHSEDANATDYQASYAADTTPPPKDPGPGNRHGLRAYLLGTVDENEYIEQRHRSDIVDDDRTLTFGTGIDTSSPTGVYDGSREETIFVDAAWLSEQIASGTPAHNETTGKQGGRDDGGEGNDEKEYYHLTKAEWNWVRAKIAEEEA